MTGPAILAADLGGSGLRVGLLDLQGRMLATRAATVDADPRVWWERLCVAAVDSMTATDAAVAGICICGMTRTQVFVGADGDAVRPAIGFGDTRAAEAVERAEETLDLAGLPEAANLNPYHPAARLLWLQQAEPDNHAATRTVLEPKDWLAFRLTGVARSDAISTARLRAAAAPVAGRSLLDALGLDARMLPEIVAPTAEVGRVRPGLPPPFDRLAGVPVFCGSHDTWAGVVGLGALVPGRAYNVSGTSEVLGLITERAVAAPGLVTVDWGEGWQVGGPSQTGGATLRHVLRMLGRSDEDPAAAVAALDTAEFAGEPPLFLPFLEGERVPYWDADLRGAFIGLSSAHGPADLLWSALEGIALLNREVLRRAEAAAGRPAVLVRLGGGGARSDLWARIKADALGRPVELTDEPEAGLVGAAAVAWTGLGRYPDLAAAQAATVRVARRIEPDPARAAAMDRRAELWAEMQAATSEVGRRLGG
ncbi:MAG: FGGY-family carbohydrate kinase [Thalassobaculum sp.]|uniref:xylulokinase n=1 Tax=Thalassobaculum sp. TaxID=2022740 RepID=UPI0032EF662E